MSTEITDAIQSALDNHVEEFGVCPSCEHEPPRHHVDCKLARAQRMAAMMED